MKRSVTSRAVALALILAMLLASCAKKETVAATMFIQKTEGDVNVEDGDGKDIKAVEGLGLYNGYSVATRKKSYSWIDLDKVKLAKLDEKSEVEIHKHKRKLELVLYSGGLFFDVTEPLKDDETMTIRTSTMLVGIRGTCGWVYCEEDDSVTVALLRGKVECSVLNDNDAPIETEIITAGERASLVREGDDAEITVTRFKPAELPEFVKPEIEDSDDYDEIIAVLNSDGNTPSPGDEQPDGPTPIPAPVPDEPPEEPVNTRALAGLEGVAYHGSAADCKLTPAQAQAYIDAINNEMETQRNRPYHPNGDFSGAAALVDGGSGVPVLVFVCGWFRAADVYEPYRQQNQFYWTALGSTVVWQLFGDNAVRFDQQGEGGYGGRMFVDGYVYVGYSRNNYVDMVHRFDAEGHLPDLPYATVAIDWSNDFRSSGLTGTYLTHVFCGSDMTHPVANGLAPLDDVLAALQMIADGGTTAPENAGSSALPFTGELNMTSYAGAGSYHDSFVLNSDGTFTGGYYMGLSPDSGSFSGRVTNINHPTENSWTMTVDSIDSTYDQVIHQGDELTLYRPGTPISELPRGLRDVINGQASVYKQVLDGNIVTCYAIFHHMGGWGYSTLSDDR